MVTSRNAALTVAMILGLILGGCASSNPTYGGGGGDGGADLARAVPDLAQGNHDLSAPPVIDMTTGDLAGVPLKNPGDTCIADTQCKSMTCRPLGPNGTYICLGACKTQADCATVYQSFCEPATAGGTAGFCIPPSPHHCSSCTKDSDCGVMTERCLIGTGDNTAACHVDCSLDATACPPDYQCASFTDNGTMRRLCMPASPATCLDAVGGYCDRVALPQTCARSNAAGTCTGQRVCLAGGRFDRCNATGPTYKMTCSTLDPPGCTEAYAPGIANDASNCGTCGHACAGGQGCCGGTCTNLGTTSNCSKCGDICATGSDCCSSACTSLSTVSNCGACGNACPAPVGNNDISCANPAAKQCGMTCRGENYDVNNNMTDGCEKPHATPPGHQLADAYGLPNSDCYGSNGTVTKTMLSDSRVHNPALVNFSGTVGSAPDYFQTYNTGGTFCCDTYSITFSTTGGGATQCYKMTIQTNKTTNSVTVNGNGSASMNGPSSGAWSDNSTIQFIVSKVCSLPVQETVSYTIKYSLGNTLCL